MIDIKDYKGTVRPARPRGRPVSEETLQILETLRSGKPSVVTVRSVVAASKLRTKIINVAYHYGRKAGQRLSARIVVKQTPDGWKVIFQGHTQTDPVKS